MALRGCLKKATKPSSSTTAKLSALRWFPGPGQNGGRSRNMELFTIDDNKINDIEVYFGFAPKAPA